MSDDFAQDLFRQYHGEFVPSSYHAGYVVLSFVVSLIGALSTLELVNRRTAQKGLFNHVLLFGAAVTMGGVAIWCMHFIGNLAIVMANGEEELQIMYSPSITAASFFVPICVLLTAFTALGASDSAHHSWIRLVGGGSLAGSAICGMHYLGNASISNYGCKYHVANVVGSAIIAVVASTSALFMFFVFRHTWANSWWKTVISGFILAGAVSGMHWCAATGTDYQLRKLNQGDGMGRTTTVIVVIVLSISTCLTMALTAVYTAKMRREYAKKAQQVVLAAAVFDQQGRILVNRNGLLPSEQITDTFLDKSSSEKFDTSHPLFHWMFRASRSWTGIQPLLDGMLRHLSQLPNQGRDRTARTNVKLVTEHGEVLEKYDVIFRELFCVAASTLASKMKESLSDVGVLWEEILTTGSGPGYEGRSSGEEEMVKMVSKDQSTVDIKDMEKGPKPRGRSDSGRGSLMLLVRKVKSEADVDRLGAAGFRFLDIHQVAGGIRESMLIKHRNIEAKLSELSRYADGPMDAQPGVHVGLFGIRPGASGPGYDVLVRKEAKHLLPTVSLPFDKLSPMQLDLLKRLNNITVTELEKRAPSWKHLSPKETSFLSQLVSATQNLRAQVGDFVADARLAPNPFQLPTSGGGLIGPLSSTSTLIALRLVMPPDTLATSPTFTFISLSLFRVHQLTFPATGPHHLAFSRAVHKELGPIINALPQTVPLDAPRRLPLPKLTPMTKLRKSHTPSHVDTDGNLIPSAGGLGRASLNRSTSTLQLWDNSEQRSAWGPPGTEQQGPEQEPAPVSNLSMLGGIMISEEVTVNVDVNNGSASSFSETGEEEGEQSTREPRRPGTSDRERRRRSLDLHAGRGRGAANIEAERPSEQITFVDELFAICMNKSKQRENNE